MTDAALFHSILCGTALFWDIYESSKIESLAIFKHMKEAVHLLSARLQDPVNSISDSTMVTVAHLAEYEASTSSSRHKKRELIVSNVRQIAIGNFANWKNHIDGLLKMVQLRGGFESLGDDLKNKVLRYRCFNHQCRRCTLTLRQSGHLSLYYYTFDSSIYNCPFAGAVFTTSGTALLKPQ